MRVVTIHAAALAMIALLSMPPAAALFDVGFMGGPVNTGAVYALGPDFTVLVPFSQGSYIMNEARTSTLARTATGSLAISFQPPGLTGPDSFPAISPAIAQTTSQTVAATRSYFFNDFVSG